ncbi:MAG: epoxyqueuosine reductase, partial [bacterium]|nr:epoxyqueuosine reductase [bacterium]
LAAHVLKEMRAKGFDIIAPIISAHFSYATSEKYGAASNWSERHTAFVSGLGTFGLSDGLITPVGKAVRFGSAIIKAVIDPTVRPYSSPHEYCLFYNEASCMDCVLRCPIGAIGEDGHDKARCAGYINEIVIPHIKTAYNLGSSCCGLCQTKVPCSDGIPAMRGRSVASKT